MIELYTEQQRAAEDRWIQLMGSFEPIRDRWLAMIDEELARWPASPYFTDESKSQ